jgi:hypothetical protein
VLVIARLVAADEDTIREVIHRFNELGFRDVGRVVSKSNARRPLRHGIVPGV